MGIILNPNILADKIVEIYDNNPNFHVFNPKIRINKLNYKMLLIYQKPKSLVVCVGET